jgi:hypothetical protein
MTAPVQTGKRPGVIATFYSFKGGVGRSMTLANVASLLSKWGQRVLIADWDLEAPGIEKFFAKWLQDEPGPKDGIVDLIGNWSSGSEMDWRSCRVIAAPQGGQEIHLITAGKQDGKYVGRLRALDWEGLFREQRLGNYLEKLRREWKAEYDFIFVDSRTGVTDTGGICTIHLPDVLVAMFVANDQSLKGVRSVIDSAGRGHSKMPVDRTKLLVIPVPSRDESDNEHDLAEQWRNKFADELKDFFDDWVPLDEKYTHVLDYLKIPYVPYWSFGERIPVLEQENPDNPKTLAYAYQPLAKLLLGGLDWREVREGSLAKEQASKQAAETERLRAEAAAEAERLRAIAEDEKRRSDEQKLREVQEEVQNRKKRAFESAVGSRIEFWSERAHRYAIVDRWLPIALVCALAACLTSILPWRAIFPAYERGLLEFAVASGVFGLVAVGYRNLSAPEAKERTAQLIASRLSSERSLFQSSAEPYAGDPESALARYVSTIEQILSDGERDYSGHGPRKGQPASTPPA